MTFSEDLVWLIDRSRHAPIPDRVRHAATLRLLDGLAVLEAGSRSGLADTVDRYVHLRKGETNHSIDRPLEKHPWTRLAPEELGFVLGTWAFAHNYADTSLVSVAHPGSIVVPALLVGCQHRPVNGTQVLRALIAGYDVTEAVASVLNVGPPRMGNQIRGFRPTAMAGPFGTVAVLACLWQLDSKTTQAALEIACNLAAGLRRSGRSANSPIRIQSALAVRAGISACLLAQAGLQGESQLFEGEGGFFRAHGVDLNHISAVSDVVREDVWSVETIATKFHCTAHNLASALDAVLECFRLNAIMPDQVARIEIEVPEAHAIISERRAKIPDSFSQARNSIEFTAAVAAVSHDYMWPSTLRSYLHDRTVLELSGKVKFAGSPDLTREFETELGNWPARTQVTALSGATFSAEVRRPVGTGLGVQVEALLKRKVELLLNDSTAIAEELIHFCQKDIDRCDDVGAKIDAMGLLRRTQNESD